jgi:hypothetical protein
MTDWSRGYFKRAVQPKCEVQGANCAVQTLKMCSPKISTSHLCWTEMSLINEKQCTQRLSGLMDDDVINRGGVQRGMTIDNKGRGPTCLKN